MRHILLDHRCSNNSRDTRQDARDEGLEQRLGLASHSMHCRRLARKLDALKTLTAKSSTQAVIGVLAHEVLTGSYVEYGMSGVEGQEDEALQVLGVVLAELLSQRFVQKQGV